MSQATVRKINRKAAGAYKQAIKNHGIQKRLFLQVVRGDQQKNNKLRSGNKFEVKESVRGEFDQVGIVERAVTWDISKEMVYCGKKFHELPHSSANQDRLNAAIKAYREQGNLGQGAAVRHIKINSPGFKCFDDDLVKVAFIGSEEVTEFQQLGVNQQRILEFVASNGEVKPGHDEGGEARRISIRFSQPQNGKNSHKKRVMWRSKKMG